MAQERQPGERRSLSPAPISDTITTNSVSRSAATSSAYGRGPSRDKGSEKISMPMATMTIGNEIGSRSITCGSTAAPSTATPNTASSNG